MDFASLQEQLRAMLQSDAPMFTIGTFVVTERIAAIAGIISAILTLISLIQIIINVFRWIFSPKEDRVEMRPTIIEKSPTQSTTQPVTNDKTAQALQKNEQDSITDSSEKKRSLYDYVTPDSIHAEVLKQTLNNDYPYQVLRPGTFLQQPKQEPVVEQEAPLTSVEFAQTTIPVIQPQAAPTSTMPPEIAVPATPASTVPPQPIEVPVNEIVPAVAPPVPVTPVPIIAEVATPVPVVTPAQVTPATPSPTVLVTPEPAKVTESIPPHQVQNIDPAPIEAKSIPLEVVTPVATQPTQELKPQQQVPYQQQATVTATYSPTDPILP